MNGLQEIHMRKVADLEYQLLEWTEGRRSHTNTIRGTTDDPARETVLIAQADAAEVEKLSAAIQALNSRTVF